MKQKIYLGLIIILILIVGIIQYQLFKFNQKSNEKSDIKSKEINTNFELPNIEIDKIKLPPLKKENYIEPAIWAKNYILIDIDIFYPLAEKNCDAKVPIASTTKIMTAIIVLENYKLDDVVTVSNKAASQIGDAIYLITDEKLTVKSLLYALLVQSGNDAAMALAEHMGYEKFMEKMNEKAKYLGLNDTFFKDPSGLDDSAFSTAKDLAIVTSYAMRSETFRKSVSTIEITISSIEQKYANKLKNSNRLLVPDELLFYQNAIGVKTGYTPDAGHCLVAAAEKNNHTLVSVVLNTNENSKDASARESKKLLEWGFDNFKWN